MTFTCFIDYSTLQQKTSKIRRYRLNGAVKRNNRVNMINVPIGCNL